VLGVGEAGGKVSGSRIGDCLAATRLALARPNSPHSPDLELCPEMAEYPVSLEILKDEYYRQHGRSKRPCKNDGERNASPWRSRKLRILSTENVK
jgi:hypothetical protein